MFEDDEQVIKPAAVVEFDFRVCWSPTKSACSGRSYMDRRREKPSHQTSA